MIEYFQIDISHFNKIGNVQNFNHHTKETFIENVLKLNGKIC